MLWIVKFMTRIDIYFNQSPLPKTFVYQSLLPIWNLRLSICIAYFWAQLEYKGKQLFWGRFSIAWTGLSSLFVLVLAPCVSCLFVCVAALHLIESVWLTCLLCIYGWASNGEVCVPEMISGQLCLGGRVQGCPFVQQSQCSSIIN